MLSKVSEGKASRPIQTTAATICRNVLSFPQMLGGNLRAVVNVSAKAEAARIRKSRPKTIATNHHGMVARTARHIYMVLSSTLSAIGSR